MKHHVRRFKSQAIGLKELEPFILDGEHLQTGRAFDNLGGLLSREALANWLLCEVKNFEEKTGRFSFTTAPTGGDGIIFNEVSKDTWITEHVLVPRTEKSAEAILEKIEQKIDKGGEAYASGKSLVVFINANFAWFPNKITKQLPEKLYFSDVWVIARQGIEDKEHVYTITSLDMSAGDAPVWFVRIKDDFKTWRIERFQ